MSEFEDQIKEDEIIDEKEAADEKSPRWSYFIVREVTAEMSSKVEVKKWLSENGLGDHRIIRGRVLPTGERVVRKIVLG